jgi:phosphatidylinositol N-acetylglucosaminyltransferase subunit A
MSFFLILHAHHQGTVNVVVISRLVYRKGVDLVAPVLRIMAQRYSHLHFIVGGDGPKRLLLEEMRERYQVLC